MATKTVEKVPDAVRTVAPVKRMRFEAPEELAAKFGVQAQTPEHIQGVVATDDVRELLDGFGLHRRADVVFPFQHIATRHGETWSMRVEAAAPIQIDGKHVIGHQWVYMRQKPELTQNQQ